MINDAHFEVDGGYGDDGRQTRGFITLTGDMELEFDKYLLDDDADSVTIQIDKTAAEHLYRDLEEWGVGR